jgi:membrane protein DedA with SNARE-associated domain
MVSPQALYRIEQFYDSMHGTLALVAIFIPFVRWTMPSRIWPMVGDALRVTVFTVMGLMFLSLLAVQSKFTASRRQTE